MALDSIIGRHLEIAKLQRVYDSDKSEFVAVCGRRRIGKTFLVKEYFEGKFVFKVSGQSRAGFKKQLKNFNNEIERQFPSRQINPAENWIDAFNNLKTCVESTKKRRKVIFIDELPWLDTQKSGFVSALENFWNEWAYYRHDIVLVACGSATSWMMDKLINSKGGLHNRLTEQLFLEPFNLNETEQMLKSQGLHLSRYEIGICYMIFGGVPYYLSLLDSTQSLAQNVDSLIFDKRGRLHNEFDNLYTALFKKSDDYVAVVSALATKRSGMSRKEILQETSLKSGSKISKILSNLEYCGFIRCFTDLSKGKPIIYQLVDFYTLFYFRFLKGKQNIHGKNYWLSLQGKPTFNAWAGLTFELLCIHHIDQIKWKLGIYNVLTEIYGWRGDSTNGGAQVDLVLQRQDRTFSLCEMKFSEYAYSISKDEDLKLRNRINAFKMAARKPSYSIRLAMVTSFGLEDSKYNSIVSDQITLDDLFSSLP